MPYRPGRRKGYGAMKKGDLKKQQILSAAEDLFCRKGYEQTSIQEIIDRLRSSKGSFYHHFENKEALLEGICRNRAASIFRAAEDCYAKESSSVRRLDILLSGMIPLREERLSFLLMLLPVFSLPEGRTVRQYYCDALSDEFHASVSSVIRQGCQEGEMFCTDPENAASLVLFLVNRLWVQISDRIISDEKHHDEPDLSECLRFTDSCRLCIERFLFLPYGSVGLTDFPALRLLSDQIHNHWPE